MSYIIVAIVCFLAGRYCPPIWPWVTATAWPWLKSKLSSGPTKEP